MGIMTGEQFLQSLQDEREIWIDGERIADVTTDVRMQGAAQTLAELYDMQHEPDLIDNMTYVSPSTGDRVGLSHIEPKSVDDLRRRRRMVKLWMDHTCGMLGRSMDFMNVFVAGFASAWREFERDERPYGQFLRQYYEYIRENDLALTHTLVNPQVNRAKAVEEQDNDIAARVVGETRGGMIVRGARMVSTLCAYANEILFAPSTHLVQSDAAIPFAIAFALPVATPGLRFVCRPSLIHQQAGSAMDNPLSNRFDEGDGVVIFEDVLVPWERVFIYKDVEMVNGLYDRSRAINQIMHQFSTKNLAKAEFMMGLAFAMAESSRVDAHLHVQGMLAEMTTYTETVRGLLIASETEAYQHNEDGVYVPHERYLWPIRMLFPPWFRRLCEIIQSVGAGGIVAVPSFADMQGERAGDVARYFQSANGDAHQRIRLFRLAFDAAVSSFSGRQQLYERYYSGDPVRLGGVLYHQYDKAPYIERINAMLDDLEARTPPGPGTTFKPRRAVSDDTAS